MRLFSWYGAIVIAAAAGFGYVAGVHHQPAPEPVCPASIPSHEEEATAPPGLALEWRRTLTEDIDLTCPPNVHWNFDLSVQSSEPPVAQPCMLDPAIRQTSFELPSGGPALPPVMPYCDD